MALILNGTTGITVTDGSNILQDGTVTTDDLAAGAVTSAKMATGAAATNLGNYVQSFNGSTGAVSYTAPVTSVNGSTGAVTVQATLVSGSNIKTVGGQSLLGSGNVDAGMQVDTNTSSSATTYAVGTYILMLRNTSNGAILNTTRTPTIDNQSSNRQTFFQDNNDFWTSTRNTLSGTWRVRGGWWNNGGLNISAGDGSWQTNLSGNIILMQRTA